MIGIVVVTHGRVAEELVNAARTIVGEIPAIAAVSIGWGDDPAAANAAIEKGLDDVGGGEALILTDMFGGTPSNISLSFLDEHHIEVVTGFNLPMLIKLATLREEKSLDDIASFIKDYGRRNISVASELVSDGGR